MRTRLVISLWLAAAAPLVRGQPPDPEKAKAWEAVLAYPRNCVDDALRRGVRLQARYHSLEAKQYLVEVGCTWAAYEGTEIFFLLDTAGAPTAKLLEFTNYQDNGSTIEKTITAELPGSVEWDAKTRQLSVFERFSGAGNCGLFQVYSIAGGRPKLITARGKIKCAGPAISNPRTMPLLPQFVRDSRPGKR